jgi:putative membrane protein
MKALPIVLAACLALASCSQLREDSSSGQGTTASSKEVELMRDLAQANLAEIDTGKLALSKAKSDSVKQFAQQMVDEHSKMMQEGQQLAAAQGVRMPSSPGVKHQVAKKRLEMGSSDNFDKAYMEQMVLDHQQTLDLLKQAASSGDASLQLAAQAR